MLRPAHEADETDTARVARARLDPARQKVVADGQDAIPEDEDLRTRNHAALVERALKQLLAGIVQNINEAR